MSSQKKKNGQFLIEWPLRCTLHARSAESGLEPFTLYETVPHVTGTRP
jgi:hypothetical protein